MQRSNSHSPSPSKGSKDHASPESGGSFQARAREKAEAARDHAKKMAAHKLLDDDEDTLKPGELRGMGSSKAAWLAKQDQTEKDETVLGRIQETAEKIAENTFVQGFVGIAIVCDLSLTIYGFVVDEEAPIVWYLNLIVILILMVDVTIRMLAEGKEFFKKCLNIVELIVVVLCIVFHFAESEMRGFALGRTLRPLFRVIKGLRLASKAALSKGRIGARFDKMIDSIVDSFVDRMLSDLLYLPSENVTVKASSGLVLVQKAHVIASAFEGLHIPFTVKGGLLELLHIDLGLDRSKKKTLPGIEVTIQNMLLVVGPGHHQVPPKAPWTFDSVAEMKTQLVDRVAQRFEKSHESKDKKKDDDDEQEVKGVIPKFIRHVKRGLKTALTTRVQVKVRNLSIRYEDDCELQGQHVMGYMKIGSIDVNMLDSAALAQSQSPSKGSAPINLSSQNLPSEGKCRARGLWHVYDEDKAPRSEQENILRGITVVNRVSFWFGVDVDPSALYSPGLANHQKIHKMARRFRTDDLRERLQMGVLAYEARPRGTLRRAWSNGFVLQPMSVSIHTLIRHGENQSAQDKQAVQFWLPSRDIDIKVEFIGLFLNRDQLATFTRLGRYVKQWKRDDDQVQWRPHMPPGDDNGLRLWKGSTSFWWPYAVQRVQYLADPDLSWKLRNLMQFQRRGLLLQAYTELYQEKLESGRAEKLRHTTTAQLVVQKVQRDKTRGLDVYSWNDDKDQRFQELTVALPLLDLIRARKEALLLDAARIRQRRISAGDYIEDEDDGKGQFAKSFEDVALDVGSDRDPFEDIEELDEQFQDLVEEDGGSGTAEFDENTAPEAAQKQQPDKSPPSVTNGPDEPDSSKHKDAQVKEHEHHKGHHHHHHHKEKNPGGSTQLRVMIKEVSICLVDSLEETDKDGDTELKTGADCPNSPSSNAANFTRTALKSRPIARFDLKRFEANILLTGPPEVQMLMVPAVWEQKKQGVSENDSCLTSAQQASVEILLSHHFSGDMISKVLEPFGVTQQAVVKYLLDRTHPLPGWIAVDFFVEDVLGVNYTAPSQALPFVRKLFNSHRRGEGDPTSFVPLGKGRRDTDDKTPLEPLFFMRLTQCPKDAHSGEKKWTLAMQVQPTEIVAYKPFLEKVQKILKPPATIAYYQKGVHIDIDDSVEFLLAAMRKHFLPKKRFEAKHRESLRLFEKATGSAHERWDIMIVNGGMSATILQPFSERQWVLQRVLMPSGRHEMTRNGTPPHALTTFGLAEAIDVLSDSSMMPAIDAVVSVTSPENASKDSVEGEHRKIPMSSPRSREPNGCSDKKFCSPSSCCKPGKESGPSFSVSRMFFCKPPADVDPGPVEAELQQLSPVEGAFEYENDLDDDEGYLLTPRALGEALWQSQPLHTTLEVVSGAALGLPMNLVKEPRISD